MRVEKTDGPEFVYVVSPSGRLAHTLKTRADRLKKLGWKDYKAPTKGRK